MEKSYENRREGCLTNEIYAWLTISGVLEFAVSTKSA